MRQAETLPSGILIKRLSGLKGDLIWIQFMRPEVRLQLYHWQEAPEMRPEQPPTHREGHRDRHRPTWHDNRGGNSRSEQVSPGSLRNRTTKRSTAPR
jgi:hypothetical protein